MDRKIFVVLIGLALGLAAVGPAPPAPASPGASVPKVGRYEVVERTLPWRSNAANPWEQVSADVRLVSPSRVYRIGGFYAAPDVWKFRFAPAELGRWTWSAQVREGSRRGSYRGSFVVVNGQSPGVVLQSRSNPFRWVFSNGAPYYPIGINDCTFVDGIPLKLWGVDGGFRSGQGHEPGRLVDIDTYMRAYSSAGFNLFRWGPDNCSFPLFERIDPAGNRYSLAYGAAADRLFQTLRRYGFRIKMVLFGNQLPFASSSDPAELVAVRRYARYVADRYGAYVDFWELMNEASAGDTWLTQVASELERDDPSHHPVGTNWSKPELPVMQYGTDHWYQTEDPRQSDAVAWSRLRAEPARALRKPTLVDEQGNTGQNWDPTSARRLRLRCWTAFFAEATIVFWNASFAKDYRNSGAASIYLGPTERQYVKVLQRYTENFDPRATVVPVRAMPSDAVRGYALRGPRQYGFYLVATTDSSSSVLRVTVDPARGGRATWIDPASGRVLRHQTVRAGVQTLQVPRFTIDVALKIG